MREQSEELGRSAAIAAIEGTLAKSPTIVARMSSDPGLLRTLAAGIFALNLSVADVFAEERGPEQTFTQEEMQTFERLTGMPFQELQGKYDLKMTVRPGPEGKFVIHVGQSHRHPDVLLRGATQNIVVERQQRLEEVVTNVVDANGLHAIYSEGVGKKGVAAQVRDYIRETLPELDEALAADVTTYDGFSKARRIFAAHEANMTHRAAYQYIGEKMGALFTKLKTALDNRTVVTHEEDEKEMLDFYRDAFKLSAGIALVTSGGEKPNPYNAGVDFKLLMDGKVQDLLPAEDSELNRRTFEAKRATMLASTAYYQVKEQVRNEIIASDPELKQILERRRELARKGSANLSEDENREFEAGADRFRAVFTRIDEDPRIAPLKEKMVFAQKEEDRLTLTERNAQVLRNVEGDDLESLAKGEPLGDILVIYGDDHDFTEAVTNWNAGASPHRAIFRGLVKISIKQ